METLPVPIKVFCLPLAVMEPPLSDYQELITILNFTSHFKVNSYYEFLHYRKKSLKYMYNNYAFLLLAITNGYSQLSIVTLRQISINNVFNRIFICYPT